MPAANAQAGRSSRDRTFAEDITQEAFLRTWLDRDARRDPARIVSWVAGTASNLAASELRRLRRERLATRAVDEKPVSPQRSLELKQEHVGLGRAVAALPASYREPLLAFYVEGRSASDIAQHERE